MNKDFLSQAEIDALLAGGAEKKEVNPDDYLSLFERDALGEVGNISFGTAATTLSMLLHHKVNITTPTVTVLHHTHNSIEFPTPHVAARVEYTEGLTGSNVLAIRIEDAKIIADLMLGGDGRSPAADLNELHLSAVAEAMNQMMGSASTSMSAMLRRTVNISPPTIKVVEEEPLPADFLTLTQDILIKISFHLQVGDLIDSHIMQIIPLDFATALVEILMGPAESEEVFAAAPMEKKRSTGQGPEVVAPRAREENQAYREAAPSAESAARPPTPVRLVEPVVERAMFSAFDDAPSAPAGRNLDLLLDIPLGVTVELGRTKKVIRDILDLAPGSIVELDKLAGEPVDILINNKLIARGEVVVIDENFGVRVTDIVSPAERIKRLQ